MEHMLGSIDHNGRLLRGGFLPMHAVPGQSYFPGAQGLQRAQSGLMPVDLEELSEQLRRSTAQVKEAAESGNLERTEFVGSLAEVADKMSLSVSGLMRTMAAANVPVRENLEAPAVNLIPLDTPLRNMFPRRPQPGGTAVAWKQLSSIGGAYGTTTTVTTGASSATQTVGATGGMRAGDTLYFAVTAATRTVSSIASATSVVLTATISTTTAEAVTRTSQAQPGAGVAQPVFYAETGAPTTFEQTYVDKSAAFKLLGGYGKITDFAMAAGRNYQDQLGAARVATLRNVMLNEEYALTTGQASVTALGPWGDGTNALAFNGLYNLVTTANGTPTGQVQAAVGALTTAHIDGQLRQIWEQGGRDLYMHMSGVEASSLAHLAEASGSIIRIQAQSANNVILGASVTGYVHPVTRETVDIVTSRFANNGTMIFGSKQGPENPFDGDTAACVVAVLPQVPLPTDAPESPQEIQGYVVTELARETAAPGVIPILVSVFETLQMRNANIFGKSTGLTAV